MTHQKPTSQPYAPRLTRADIEIINGALALLEADVEGEEPDPTRTGYETYDGFADEHAEWQARLDQIRAVREKVHVRRDRLRRS